MVLRFSTRLFGISSSSISKVRSTDARFSFEPDRGGAFTACWRRSWEGTRGRDGFWASSNPETWVEYVEWFLNSSE